MSSLRPAEAIEGVGRGWQKIAQLSLCLISGAPGSWLSRLKVAERGAAAGGAGQELGTWFLLGCACPGAAT